MPLHVPLVADITNEMPTSFEDFVQQEQKRIQEENASKGEDNTNYRLKLEVSSKKTKHTGNNSNDSNNSKDLVDSSLSSANDSGLNSRSKIPTNEKGDKHAKARNAIAEAVALTNSHAVAIKNGSQSVLPGNANATEDEIDAAMKEQKDLPVGNTKEERKKRRLVRNRVSAQLHRERKKKYIAALETKVKEQNEQLLHLGKIIQIMNIEYQRLQNAATKNMCPSCVSSGSDSSIPFSSSGSDTSSSSSPLTGPDSDDLDPEFDDNARNKRKQDALITKTTTCSSNVHWVNNTTPTTISLESCGDKSSSSRKRNAGTSVHRNKRNKKFVADTRRASLLDESTDALINSSDEDMQKYADTLLSPVNLCDDDEEDATTDNIDKAPFDTSFIFNDNDGFDNKFDDLMNSPNNIDIANAFDLQLSDDEDGTEDTSLSMFCCNDNGDNKTSKKRKRSHNKATAMLFGMFFMCAFFGSYIGGVMPSSKTVIHLPSAANGGVASSLPLLGNGHRNVATADNSNTNTRRRRRRLLSSDEPVNQSDARTVSSQSSLTLNNVNTDDKAIALWQNILHDMEASPSAKYPAVGNSDVKQLLLKIGNFSHTYKNSKIINRISSSNNIANGQRKQALRARSRDESTSATSTLIPYHKMNGTVDVNTVFTQNMMNTNASFMLCPKPYGSLAHTDAQTAASPSHHNTNNKYEHVPNTFMYDDIKVNRDLVLLMPSTSLGGKMGPGTNQQWDGQWVQVDAVVRSVRPAVGLSGLKAIAGSQ